jgi:hypothetical protein
MKNICAIFVSILALFVMPTIAQENRAEILKAFVKDIPSLATENVSTVNGLIGASQKKATKTIDITKENMKASLQEAQGKTCILVVGSHTFVKFSDTKKCAASGSWGTCMPYGEGYILNNGFKSVNDYINNIIGKPDDQKRMLFIF